MKKLLLATTALVMTAGVAAADVALSGNARMGLFYNGDDVVFTSRARVQFTMSGESDSGLAFGATFRADQAGAANGMDMTGGNVFIKGEFGTLRMGDVDGAAEFITGDLHGVGLTGLRFLNENAYLSNSAASQRTAARYEYSMDGWKFAVSADQLTATNNAYAIGLGYTFDGFGVGIGYEDLSNVGDHVIVYGSASFEDINVKATYGRLSVGGTSFDQYGISMSAKFDAVGVSAFARRDFAEDTHYGLGASYDLGGGASIVGGVVRDGGASQTIADLGLSFTF